MRRGGMSPRGELGGAGVPMALFLRLLLAASLALSCGLDGARAQVTCGGEGPPCPPHIPTPSHHDNTGAYVVGGIVAGFIGSIILSKIWPSQPTVPSNPTVPPNPAIPTTPITPASLQPSTINLPPSFPGVPGGIGPLRPGFSLPPPGAPIMPDEVLFETRADADAIAVRHQMTLLESHPSFLLTGRTLYRAHVDVGSVADKLLDLSGDRSATGGRPIYSTLRNRARSRPTPTNMRRRSSSFRRRIAWRRENAFWSP